MLGNVLGTCLSNMEGLNAVYLPAGVDPALGEELVERASALRAHPDFAILVSPQGHMGGMSVNAALRYRQGDRLAVVMGRHSDLGSFNQSFEEVVGLNYPDISRVETSLERLAQVALREALNQADIAGDTFVDEVRASTVLRDCLLRVKELHQNLRQGTESWNVYWFAHVDAGLRRLVDLLQSRKAEGVDLTAFFATYVFACFGLPRPKPGLVKPVSTRTLIDAFQTHWSDSSSISNTVKFLEHHPSMETDRYKFVQAVNWLSFDRTLAQTGNYGMAFVGHIGREPSMFDALANLFDSEFVDPVNKLNKAAQLVPLDSSFKPLSIQEASVDKGPFMALGEIDQSQKIIVSEVLRICIPTVLPVSTDQFRSSAIRVTGPNSRIVWEGEVTLAVDGSLVAVGRVIAKFSKKAKLEPKAVKLSIDLPDEDALAGLVVVGAPLSVYLAPVEGAGVWTIPIRGAGSFGRQRYWGQELSGPAPNQLITAELDPEASQHRYVVWTTSSSPKPILDGVELEPLHGRSGIFATSELTPQVSSLSVGDYTFEFRSPESGKASHSPVVSALLKSRASTDPLPSATMGSLRGAYEAHLAGTFDEKPWLAALGHVVLAADRLDSVTQCEAGIESGLMMSPELAAIWPAVSDFVVPQELVDSTAAKDFRDAFRSLGCESLMNAGVTEDGTSIFKIASKTSWRSLWQDDRGKLDRYLETYAELVVEARRMGNAAGVFWATYPMSLSIWETDQGAKCSAVLLSPLHPLRLAWLAGVENVLWNSSLAQQLAGTIEGWNFPLVGPRETDSGRLVAVPLESGHDQVFLGWSIMVRASVDGHLPLVAPERAGDYPVPGTAVSGLNAPAVSAALRNYRKMNPQVSTVTIDLAATSETNRLVEVDEAVLRTVGLWANDKNCPLIGGARIWDSTRRAGKIPEEQLARLVRASDGVPVIWRRYVPDAANMKRCNMRILQDPGVQVLVKSSSTASRLGVLGGIPLRRFEAVSASESQGTIAVSSPTIREDRGWAPYSRALRECEGGTTPSLISTKLFQANIVSHTADWTVSGEALMNPSAMASIVQKASAGSQMLWEWRPPFLEASGDIPALERRPFVSIAKVPQGFRNQMKQLLAKAIGRTSTDADVDALLGKLGSRGVGLSAMLSMGGTHASGALGFFLVFALMERVQTSSPNTYVLPIDACDTFLRALAKGAPSTDSVKRADILMLRITEAGVILAPVEIKFYGLGADHSSAGLPDIGSSALREPLDQLTNTMMLLKDVRATWEGIQVDGNEGDRALWSNGFGALIEAAIRLQPAANPEPDALAKALTRIVDGQAAVQLGKPLVAYFKHEAQAADGSAFSANMVESEDAGAPVFGLLSANAAAAFGSVAGAPTILTEAWQRLVDWSLDPSSPDSSAAQRSPDSSAAQRSPDSSAAQRSPDSSAAQRGASEHIGRGFSAYDNRLRLAGLTPGDARIAGTGASPRHSIAAIPAEADIIGGRASLAGRAPDAMPVGPAYAGGTIFGSENAGSEEGHPGDSTAFTLGIRPPGVKFPVGRMLGRSAPRDAFFWPGNTDLNQMNVGVVGDLGTGKTQLMKALIYQLRSQAKESQETPLSMLIFDYKRDFQDAEFLGAVGGQVLRVDRIPLNFFQLREGYTPMAANQRANEFIDVLDKIYGGIGPVQKDRLSVAITDLYRENKSFAPTIGRVLARYGEDGRIDAVTSILRRFVNSEIFSEDYATLQSFGELVNDKVLVVALNDFGTDDEGKNSLVVLFLNLYYDYMLASTKWPFVGASPQLRRLNSFLIVDEAVNVMKYKFPVLMNLLLQGREFGFGVMLATQYLSHFKKDQENYGEPLLTWFIHKVKSASARELQQLGINSGTIDLSQRILQLERHQSLYSSLGHKADFIEDYPFFRLIDGGA